jgi:hypothetical protein
MRAAWDLVNFPRVRYQRCSVACMWTKGSQGCWNMMGVNFFTSSVNMLIDICIFILPFPTLQKLQMAYKKKCKLRFTFDNCFLVDKSLVTLILAYCMGLLAIGCSIVRLRNIIHFNGQGDFTYVASMVPVWGAIEANAGIICGMFTVPARSIGLYFLLTNEASLPFLVPLFKRDRSPGTKGSSDYRLSTTSRRT